MGFENEEGGSSTAGVVETCGAVSRQETSAWSPLRNDPVYTKLTLLSPAPACSETPPRLHPSQRIPDHEAIVRPTAWGSSSPAFARGAGAAVWSDRDASQHSASSARVG